MVLQFFMRIGLMQRIAQKFVTFVPGQIWSSGLVSFTLMWY